MNSFFKKVKVGVLNDHFDILGGGTVHSFKFIEYLKRYYDVEVNVPGNPKTKEWMRDFLHLDTDNLTILPYVKGCGDKYDYLFLNISHWRAEPTKAIKKFMLVFFPQFFFPLYDYDFLANSQYTADNIVKRWKQLPEKVHVVHPPIMTSQFKPLKKTKSILHVSRITPPVPEADKGHRQMINAFKEMVDAGLKDWTLDIVGQVQDQLYCDELRRMAQGYPIVFHLGVPFKELQELYGQASLYWHLTGITMPDEAGAQEHFGMTTVEAMASGCVPIVLGTGGQTEIIEDNRSGFLIKDTNELKSKTMYLINDPDLMGKMSKDSIQRSKLFDEEETKKTFYSLISKTNKVSICMLCWNNSQFTKDCVDRLYEVTPEGFELILVDNASKDDTWKVIQDLQKKYPNIKAIRNTENVGFARGNNQALKIAKGEYILYLNNDTLPQWGWLERMIDVIETRPEVGIVGARLYFNKDDNGVWKIQHAGVKFNHGVTDMEHIGRYRPDNEVRGRGCEEVEAVTGACLLIRKELAGFDEGYIRGYYEDIDLCLRTREKGYKIIINHEAKLIHYEGKSLEISRKADNKTFAEITKKNRELFNLTWPTTKIKNLPKISMVPDLKGIEHEEKIEVGGGDHPLHPEYAQVDLRRLPHIKYNNDARILPFPGNSLSDISSSYMINCLPKEEAEVMLNEWLRCLKPGGRLEIYIPDLGKIAKNFISTRDEELLKEIYGYSSEELEMFKWGYSFETLDVLLSKVHFVRIASIKPSPLHLNSLGIEAFKYEG